MNDGWLPPAPEGWVDLAWQALAEDVGPGDLTASCLEPGSRADWYIEAQAEGVVCGVGIASYLLEGEDDEDATVDVLIPDGARVRRGDMLLRGSGDAASILSRERTALNFLMHLSGVASLAAKFVEQVRGLEVAIVDTRKTIPGLRALQKYAVRCGGAKNHRMGLYDAVMIKDNHIQACGSITAVVTRARSRLGPTVKVEVEAATLEQAQEAAQAGADIVMLDNMDPFAMAAATKELKGKVLIEASGGVTLETVRAVAQSGVDFISVGALTHSAPALPLHLELE